MKGKAIGIFLLICLVAPIVVTFTFLHYQKKQVRKEVKHQIIAGIDKSELVLLKFTEEESQSKLKWEHSREFEYNDQMYDIVETEIKWDTIYYWCWWDNKETKLNKQLDNLLANALENNPIKKDNQKRLTNFYKSLYCQQLPNWHWFSFQTEQMTTDYTSGYLTIFYPPPVPPPEKG
jgi:hypothetical protein